MKTNQTRIKLRYINGKKYKRMIAAPARALSAGAARAVIISFIYYADGDDDISAETYDIRKRIFKPPRKTGGVVRRE